MTITYRNSIPAGAAGTLKASALTSAEIDANFATLQANPTFTGANVTLPSQSVALTGSVLPSIRPSLNLDFANSKQLDPRITFTRGSSATYYDGKTTAVAEQNLLKGSNDFSNAAYWTTTNASAPATGITAPDGTLTAYSFTATAANATLYQTITTSALAYTFTIYLQLGTVTGTVNLTLDGITLVPKTITSTWARYDISNSTLTAASRTLGLKLSNSGNVVNIWGAQLEQRSQATAYTPTTTAPITNYIPQLMTAPLNVARIDHEPISGKCLGLLIEEARTNLLTYSQDFSAAIWNSSSSAKRTYNTIIAPDGNLTGCTATTIAETNGGLTRAYYAYTASSYTYSIYVKKGNWSYVGVRIGGSVSVAGLLPFLNMDNGVANANGISGATITSTSVGNGWYRLALTYTPLAGSAVLDFALTDSSGNCITNLGAGQYAYIWGAQLEAGTFATSYIVNNGTPAGETRFADQASMTGTNFSSWYNLAESAWCVDYDSFSSLLNGFIFAYCSGARSAFRLLNAGQIAMTNRNTGASDTVKYVSNTASGKMAGTVKSGGSMLTLNGAIPTSNTVTFSAAETFLIIGCLDQVSGYLNGHIKKLTYYPKALIATELQGLTAL